MIITLDCDGVVASGEYDLPEQRTWKHWMEKSLFSEDVPTKLNKLQESFKVYLISGRTCLDMPTWLVTGDWLRKHGVHTLSGIECELTHEEKAHTAEALGSVAHFDDDIRVLDYLEGGPVMGYLMDNPEWPSNQTASYPRRIHTWQDIMKVCSDLLKKENQ